MSGEAAEVRCVAHAYSAKHQPGLPFYWLRQCMACGHIDPVDMVQELVSDGWLPPIAGPRPLWSILIATMSHRQDKFLKLLGHLLPQIERAAFPPGQAAEAADYPVEVVARYGVACAQPLGEIRQALLADARGDYVSFVDDDDWVADNFVAEVLARIVRRPHVVGFIHSYSRDGADPIPAYVSITHEPSDSRTALFRDYTHIQPTMTGLARLGDFRVSWPEDHYWAKTVRPYLSIEEYIPEPLYFYRHSLSDSVQEGGTFPDEPPRERPQIASPCFRWIEVPGQ